MAVVFGKLVEQRTYREGTGWAGVTWPGSPPTADITQWHYDEATGLLEAKEYADGTETVYTYDSAGRLATRTWERGVVTTYSHDPDTGELTGVSYSDTTPSVSYTYTRFGTLKEVNDTVGTREWTYTAQLRIDQERINPASGGLYTQVIERQYEDGSGLPGRTAGFSMGTVQDPAADYETEYFYGAEGRPQRVTGPGLPAHGAVYSRVADSNLLAGIDYRTDASTTVASNSQSHEPNRNLLTAVQSEMGAELVSRYGYGYNNVGQRVNVTYEGSAFNDDSFNLYVYNDRRELADARRYLGDDTGDTSQPVAAEAFEYLYDNIGNREEYAVGGASPTTYSTNALNQYTATSNPSENFVHDADGNLLEDGDWNYTWNGENRLVQVEPKGSPSAGDKRLSFEYDFANRRVRKAVEDWDGSAWRLETDQRFVYDDWNVTLVLDGTDGNAIERKFTWGLDLSLTKTGAGGVGGLLAVEETGGTQAGDYVYFYDANGNVGQLIDWEAEEIVARYEYDPFGGELVATGDYAETNPYRFSTKYWHETTGFYYYGYRYYNSETGRWPNRDPIEEEGGLNLYGFVGNDPAQTDFLGLRINPTSGRPYLQFPFDWEAWNQGIFVFTATHMEMARKAMLYADRTYTGDWDLNRREGEVVKGTRQYRDYLRDLEASLRFRFIGTNVSNYPWESREENVLFDHGTELYYAFGNARLQSRGSVFSSGGCITYYAEILFSDHFTFLAHPGANPISPTGIGRRLENAGYIRAYSVSGTWEETIELNPL